MILYPLELQDGSIVEIDLTEVAWLGITDRGEVHTECGTRYAVKRPMEVWAAMHLAGLAEVRCGDYR